MHFKLLAYLALGALITSDLAGQTMQDVTNLISANLQHSSSGQYGNGICVYDWNDDGWDDFAVAKNNATPRFFQNDGTGDFFEVIVQVSNDGDGKQILLADVDNDGDPDLLINRYQSSPLLYRNEGNMIFTDVTSESGIDQTINEGFGAAFGDFDLDGMLDLYLCSYEFGDGAVQNRLYRNAGSMTFQDVTDLLLQEEDDSPTFVASFFDHDRDGLQDLFVANDRIPFDNLLLENEDGDFSNVASSTNLDAFVCSMSSTIGDFDNDADLDIYVTNTSLGNLLHVNAGDFFFEEAATSGVAVNQFCWGAQWIDTDNDMWKDLFVCSSPDPLISSDGENFLYRNVDGLGFTFDANSGFNETASWTRATGMGDFNNDGYADLITYSDSPDNIEVYYNEGGENHFIKVTLEGVISNKDGIGSFIEVWAGDDYAMEYTLCGEAFLAQNSNNEIIGLAQHESIDSLKITWLSGIIDCFYNVSVDQHLYIAEGSSLEANIEANTTEICAADTVLLSVGDFASYAWSSGDTSAVTVVTTPGEYWCTVETFQGLVLQSDTITLTALPSPEYQLLPSAISCFGDSVATVELMYLAGPEINSVSWSNGDVGFAADSLWAGEHTVFVVDTNGCEHTTTFTIQTAPQLIAALDITGISCFGASDGMVEVEVSGGTGPYDFDWNGINPEECTGGDQLLTITDGEGCVTQWPFEMPEPGELVVTLEVLDVDESSNGEATIVVEGGTPPYDIEWSDGSTDVLEVDDLGEGDFWVLVTDTNGCEMQLDFVITNIADWGIEVPIQVAPNPFQNELVLRSNTIHSVDISIYNNSGTLFYKGFLAQGAVKIIPSKDWPGGHYHIHFLSGTLQKSVKVIKAK